MKKKRTQGTVFLGMTNEIFFFLLLLYNQTSAGLTVKSVFKLSQTYHRLKHCCQNNGHGSLNNK